ncbi:hypothetical protein CANARDRAFT_9800 [[Candida] arabinofermentans NRRL YB-2248]|uniref:Uncharacterized protein n=1 Tax=[Candida] arabinofermentans NRRL YB-2248 TaxID=983967 RepID=A0A1E4SUN5_9ASCO|nr:hypothetical protein CANARDRAFT_9800 [[Candida] arabinofermentans NRRL YB-2248]
MRYHCYMRAYYNYLIVLYNNSSSSNNNNNSNEYYQQADKVKVGYKAVDGAENGVTLLQNPFTKGPDFKADASNNHLIIKGAGTIFLDLIHIMKIHAIDRIQNTKWSTTNDSFDMLIKLNTEVKNLGIEDISLLLKDMWFIQPAKNPAEEEAVMKNACNFCNLFPEYEVGFKIMFALMKFYGRKTKTDIEELKTNNPN